MSEVFISSNGFLILIRSELGAVVGFEWDGSQYVQNNTLNFTT
jgi:hypothetical protein